MFHSVSVILTGNSQSSGPRNNTWAEFAVCHDDISSGIMESLKRTEYYYGKDNVLQNVAVWEFPRDKAVAPARGKPKYWLV